MALRKEAIRSRFRKTAIRQGWWTTDRPIVVAVSGGGDSVALLWMLKSFWQGTVVVAHLEHGIRGASSLRDARFVQDLAASWNIQAEIGHRKIPREKKRGESIEDCARRVRYSFLEEVKARTSAEWVLLGHNANDIAETMLFHLLRGTGLRGLIGIPETRDCYARPLVDFQRQELRSILTCENIDWCEDETNSDDNYTRNFIRNQLIPLIQDKLNPAAEKHLSALSREVSLLVAEQEIETRKSLHEIRCPFPTSVRTWKQERLTNLKESTLSLCIRQEARELGLPVLDRERTSQLVKLMQKGGRWRFQWKGNLEVCCGAGLIGWTQTREPLPEKHVRISGNSGEISWGNWQIHWNVLTNNPEQTLFESGAGLQFLVRTRVPARMTIRDLAKTEREEIQRPSIPWWSEKGWPVFFIGSTMSWSPDPAVSNTVRTSDKNGEIWVRVSLIGNKQNGSEQST